MLAAGALYCWGYPAFHQGDEPGEPWDKCMVAGFWMQFALVSAILGFLWWKRVPWYVIVITPIPVAILGDPEATLANLNGNNDSLTYSDGRRAVLGWLPYHLVASLGTGRILPSNGSGSGRSGGETDSAGLAQIRSVKAAACVRHDRETRITAFVFCPECWRRRSVVSRRPVLIARVA